MSFDYKYNNMDSEEKVRLLASAKAHQGPEPKVIFERIPGLYKLPGAVASQRTLHFGGWDGSLNIKPGWKFNNHNMGEVIIDGKKFGNGVGEIHPVFETRKGVAKRGFRGTGGITLVRTKGDVTLKTEVPWSDGYNYLEAWMEKKGQAGGARFRVKKPSPPRSPEPQCAWRREVAGAPTISWARRTLPTARSMSSPS